MMRYFTSPYVLLATAACLWGGNFVLGRAIHAEIPPLSLNFWRWFASLVILLPFVVGGLRQHWGLIRAHAGLLFILALTGTVLFHSFVYVALHTTTAMNAGMVLASMPMVIPLFAYFLSDERLSKRQGLGIIVSMVGVLVIIVRADVGVLTSLAFTPGDLWILGAVVMWSVYSVLLRRLPKELPPRVMLGVIVILGTVMLLPVYVWEYATVGGFAINVTNMLSIAYVAVFASIVAFTCWNAGVAAIGANRAGLFIHLIPVSSALLAITLLGERFQSYHMAGIPLILLGIFLTTQRKKVRDSA